MSRRIVALLLASACHPAAPAPVAPPVVAAYNTLLADAQAIPLAHVPLDAPSRPALPTTSVTCVPDNPVLLSADEAPVLCWDGGCMSVPGYDEPALVARPSPTPRWWRPRAEVRDDAGRLAACLADHCRALGPKLVAAIATDRAEHGAVRLEATDDLEAVTIDGKPWAVPGDRELPLDRPRGVRKEDMAFSSARVVANLLVVEWSPACADCTRGVIADSHGKHYGPMFDAGDTLLQLDDHRFVVVSDGDAITVVDLVGGKLRGSVAGRWIPGDVQVVRLDASTLALLWQHHGYHVTWLAAEPDEPPRFRDEWELPGC